MEWNGNCGMGIWKMPEWNGMEDFKNEMEDNLPYFHTNFILDFVHCIYRKMHTDVGCVINSIVTEVFQLQYLRVIFVDKSRYFGCLYRPFAVNSSVHLVKKFEWQLIFCLNALSFISPNSHAKVLHVFSCSIFLI